MLSDHNKAGGSFGQASNLAQFDSKPNNGNKSEWQTQSSTSTANYNAVMMNNAGVVAAAQVKTSAHQHHHQQQIQQFNGPSMNGAGSIGMTNGNSNEYQSMYQITPTVGTAAATATQADHLSKQQSMLMVDMNPNRNPQLMQLLGESGAPMMKQPTAAK